MASKSDVGRDQDEQEQEAGDEAADDQEQDTKLFQFFPRQHRNQRVSAKAAKIRTHTIPMKCQ